MKHLLSIADLDRAAIEELLDLSEHFLEVTQRDIPKVPALRGKVVVSLFYEDSTRTRISFETAAKRLSCDVMSFSVGSSSVQKGESLRDTVQTIEAMGIDAVVIRHPAAGAAHRVAGWVDASVVNAGDGCHEHPTQALLDALTLRRHLGADLGGARIAIVGDILHSRVARQQRGGVRVARRARHAGRAAHAPPAVARRLAGRGEPRPRRGVARCRRRVPPPDPARTPQRVAVSVIARVHRALRPHRRPRRATSQGRARDASRADESRRRDRRRSRRGAGVAHHRTSHERSRGAHGGPLLALGSRGLACLSVMWSFAADASSIRAANASPTSWCAAGTSSRSAPGSPATRPSTRRAASSRPGSSTCTCTCASRVWRKPRPSRPGRARLRSGGSLPSSRCRIRSPRSTIPRSWRRYWRQGSAPPATCSRRAASPRVAPARRSRRWASCTTSACGSSPMTARASPMPASCATRSSIR